MWPIKIIGAKIENPEDLLRNPSQCWIANKKAIEAIKVWGEYFGWILPVVVNETTGNIIFGEYEMLTAAINKNEKVPVLYVEMSQREEVFYVTLWPYIFKALIRDSDKQNANIDYLKLGDSYTPLLDKLAELNVIPYNNNRMMKTEEERRAPLEQQKFIKAQMKKGMKLIKIDSTYLFGPENEVVEFRGYINPRNTFNEEEEF